MKIINLNKMMEKLNRINYSMLGLIENEDNSYDCNTNFTDLSCLVYKGKLIISFNKINGNFDCSHRQLITLKGCPK
jgi:hypothetical protein